MIQLFNRRTPTTTRRALRLVVGRSVRIASGPNCICEVATAECCDPERLLDEVGIRLGMRAQPRLLVPSTNLVLATGYRVEELRSRSVVPQLSPTSPCGYVLVVADPESVDQAAYRARGVPVLLGLGTRIAATWNEFQRTSATAGLQLPSSILTALSRLAADAQACGASSVLLGEGGYECMAQGERYAGTFEPGIFHLLQIELPLDRPITLEQTSPLLLTKLGPGRPIELTWEQRPTEQAATIPQAKADQPRTVLLLDDDLHFLAIVRRVLTRYGYHCVSTTDAMQALRFVESQTIDSIIADVHMPGIDGVQFLRQLRSRNGTIPVIMASSDEEYELQSQLLTLGATAFVRKRDDVRLLLRWLANLNNHSSELEVESL